MEKVTPSKTNLKIQDLILLKRNSQDGIIHRKFMDLEFNLFRQLFYAAYRKRFRKSFGRVREFCTSYVIRKIGLSNGSVIDSWFKFCSPFYSAYLRRFDFVLITPWFGRLGDALYFYRLILLAVLFGRLQKIRFCSRYPAIRKIGDSRYMVEYSMLN